MQQLTKETWKLVERLRNLEESRSWFFKARPEDTAQRLLEQIGATGEVAALCCVIPYIANAAPKLRQAARGAVKNLLAALSPWQLMSFDNWYDWSWYWSNSERWNNLKPSDVEGLAGSIEDSAHAAVLGLLSFHRNGYVRHEAVRHLSRLTDGSEFRFLLIRQNDWVEPIAYDAQAAMQARLRQADAHLVVDSLDFIFHLAAQRRYDHSKFVQAAVDVLLKEEHDEALFRTLNSSSRTIRRKVLQLGVTRPGLHLKRLVNHGLKSEDAVLRLSCCRQLLAAFEDEALEANLNELSTDRFMPVRREALRQKAELSADAASTVWTQALLDQHRAIRELACWHLTKSENVSPSDFYRKTLRSAPDLLSALDGLAETGDNSDLPLFRQLMIHPLPGRRCAGVKGLIRVAAESSINEVLPLLRDESARVVRTIWKAIGPMRHLISIEELFKVAIEGRNKFARHSAVDMISNISKWECLPWLLKIAAEANADLAVHAQVNIKTICNCNSVFTKPSRNSYDKITKELERPGSSVSKEVLDLVGIELSRFG